MKKMIGGLVAIALTAGIGGLLASPLPLIGGIQDLPFVGLSGVNTLINNINASIASFLTFANSAAEAGEMAFSSSLSFVSEGSTTCGFATASFQKCLVIVLNDGTVGFVGVQTH